MRPEESFPEDFTMDEFDFEEDAEFDENVTTFDFGAQLERYTGFDEEVTLRFVTWQEELAHEHIETDHTFPAYQIPHGPLNARTGHIFHWAPEGTMPPYSSLNFESYSIKFATSMFPGSKENDFFHDMFCKRTPILNAEGKRKENDEIYESVGLLHKHQELAKSFLEASSFEIITIWGKPCRLWFEEAFSVEPPGPNERKYRIMRDVVVEDLPVRVACVTHRLSY